jgi:hypothetical protein
MCGRIRIRIKKAYCHGMHVDLVRYGKRGIKRRIKGDYESLIYIQNIMILNWM